MHWLLEQLRRRPHKTKTVPWEQSRPSILSRIEDSITRDPHGSIDIDTDDGGREGDIRWAAGAQDALFGSPEGGRRIGARKLVTALSAAVKKPGPATLTHFYDLATQTDVISTIDEFLERAAAAQLDPRAIAELARTLANQAPDVGPVKVAMALLGISGSPADRELLMTLGRYDELTIYALVALEHILGNAEDEIWALAKKTRGWGRIRAIFQLEGTAQPDIKDWLLRDGHLNQIMPEEVAYFCAVQGGLTEALRSDAIDEELLDSLGELFIALVAGGPAEDIRDMRDGAPAATLYLQRVRASPILNFPRFLAIKALQGLVDEQDQEHSRIIDWPSEARWQIRTGAAEYLRNPGWRTLVTASLETEDEQLFWQACRVGEMLGMDVWPTRFDRQRNGLSDQWYFLMQTDDRERVQQVLSLASDQLDLERVGSGPTQSLGLGGDFADDRAVDFIVQDLCRFPGVGSDFIRIGLKGRSVRLRNMTLRALAAWEPDHWPEDITEMLAEAIEREPVDDVRDEMRNLLKRAPNSAN